MSATFSFVQSASQVDGIVGTHSIALTLTAGNAVVVFAWDCNSDYGTQVCSDTIGNDYAFQIQSERLNATKCWAVAGCVGGSTLISVSNCVGIAVAEYHCNTLGWVIGNATEVTGYGSGTIYGGTFRTAFPAMAVFQCWEEMDTPGVVGFTTGTERVLVTGGYGTSLAVGDDSRPSVASAYTNIITGLSPSPYNYVDDNILVWLYFPANPSGDQHLIIRDVVTMSPFTTSYVDHSNLLAAGSGPTGLGGSERSGFSMMIRQRGTANIALSIPASDPYQPTLGTQIFLFDIDDAGIQYTVFAGTIDNVQTSWWGQNGDRLVVLSCVTYESVYDQIRIPGRLYQNQTAGFIFADLAALAFGSPLTVGAIQDGPTIDSFLIEDAPTIAECFDKLCTQNANQFIWWVDPGTLTVNFCPPGYFSASWNPQAKDVIWENFAIKPDRHDFRDRQIIKLDYDAFGRSDEVFAGAGQKAFTLRNPVHDVTNAWITQNTANHATGTFTGLPNPGDTITVSFPTSGSIYNWSANSPYFLGQQIIDSGNHLQQVSSVNAGLGYPGVPNSGKSSGSTPSWNHSGGYTQDYGVTWQDKGAIGSALYVVATYVWVNTIDNTQPNQVLIGGSAGDCAQNLCDAINAASQYQYVVSASPLVTTQKGDGATVSLPTWENRLINCDQPAGSATITIRNKYVGVGFVAALSESCANFSWSASQTSGGNTTFGTSSISVGLTTAQAGGGGASNLPTLAYLPGTNTVYLSSPLNSGTYLAVEYHRIDGQLIAVEDTPLVVQRAQIEASTGKYQASSSDSTATQWQGLYEAQQALQAFSPIPEMLEFVTMRPGIQANMGITFGFSMPQGPDLSSTSWIVQEIEGEWIPSPNGLGPGLGHFRYTVRCVNIAQIGSYLDFWKNMGGGGGSASATPAFNGTPAPAAPPAGGVQKYTTSWTSQTSVTVTHNLGTTAVIVQVYDGSGNQVIPQNIAATSTTVVTLTFGAAFTGSVVVIG